VVLWIAATMLIIAVALFVAAPLTDYVLGGHSVAVGPEPAGRAREQALAIQALRELEFDYAMDKLDTDDYRELRQTLENRALAAMGTRQDAAHTLLPKYAEAVSASTAAASFCSQCGARLTQARNSCPSCGADPTAAAIGEIR
jgi:hypothetical protein